MKIKHSPFVLLLISMLSACTSDTNKSSQQAQSGPVKIVSLNGTLSEILVDLGLEKNIVGVDVTSTYPESLQSITKVGHNRDISAEGVLALQPDLIMGLAKDLKPEVAEQFKSAGIDLLLFEQEYSVGGTKKIIQSVADSLHRSESALPIIKKLDDELAEAQKSIVHLDTPKVLFIYARGTGTMMVAGEDTQVEHVIRLAGGQNAVHGFKDFKPLTAEALIEANPDVILLFDSGLESLGGTDGLSTVQGINQTNAGKNKHFVVMEGQLLTGFGPRLGAAVEELAHKIHGEN